MRSSIQSLACPSCGDRRFNIAEIGLRWKTTVSGYFLRGMRGSIGEGENIPRRLRHRVLRAGP